MSLTVSDPSEVLWYLVFPWGEEAEILEPVWLREEAVKIAQEMIQTYSDK